MHDREEQPEYLTAAQVAQAIGLDESTIEELSTRGLIESEMIEVGIARMRVFSRDRLRQVATRAAAYKAKVRAT